MLLSRNKGLTYTGYIVYITLMSDKEATMLFKRVPSDVRDQFKMVCINEGITMRDALIDYMNACGKAGKILVTVTKGKQRPSIEAIERTIISLLESVEEIKKNEKKAGDVEDPTARGEA